MFSFIELILYILAISLVLKYAWIIGSISLFTMLFKVREKISLVKFTFLSVLLIITDILFVVTKGIENQNYMVSLFLNLVIFSLFLVTIVGVLFCGRSRS